jgi:hypothetical protein
MVEKGLSGVEDERVSMSALLGRLSLSQFTCWLFWVLALTGSRI